MNIKKYMRHHEAALKKILLSKDEGTDWHGIKVSYEQIITRMQHERLIHLLVTLAFGMFLLVSIIIVIVKPSYQSLTLASLFFIMLIPYVAHYFFLENTVQHWYLLMDAIDEHLAFNGNRTIQEQK